MHILFYLILIQLLLNYVYDEEEKPDCITCQNVVQKGQYPFLAQIAIGKSFGPGTLRGHRCGGTLIHPFWILTAAHCFKKQKQLSNIYFEDNLIMAMMGTEKIGDFSNSSLVRIIETAYLHPHYVYKKLVFEVYIQNDIALALLKSPFHPNNFIQTIRLPDTTTRLCSCGVVIGKKSGKLDDPTCDQCVAYTSVHSRKVDEISESPTYSGKIFFTEVKWHKKIPIVGQEGSPFICYHNHEAVQYGILSSYYNNTENSTTITLYENVKKHMRFIKRWVPLKPTYNFLTWRNVTIPFD